MVDARGAELAGRFPRLDLSVYRQVPIYPIDVMLDVLQRIDVTPGSATEGPSVMTNSNRSPRDDARRTIASMKVRPRLRRRRS